MRLRLDLSYDGSGFAGWARQPGQRTVQGCLEEALRTLLGVDRPPRLTVAGRTDAGVHARGQVAHCDIDDGSWARLSGLRGGPPLDVMVARFAGLLPPEVRVRSVRVAPSAFDARFAAVSRRYVYRVGDAPWGVDPLRRHEVWWRPGWLDLAAMNDAARLLLGEHDFAAYCRARPGASSVRVLEHAEWAREPDGTAGLTVVADGFCHSMVRALVGALVTVGTGVRPVGFPAQVLAAGVRDPRVNVAPAYGLTLEEVTYPPDEQLAARVALTRRHRGAS